MQADYSQLNFFEDEQVYWAPASTIADLYTQLSSKKYREISREQIQLADDVNLASLSLGDYFNLLHAFSAYNINIDDRSAW